MKTTTELVYGRYVVGVVGDIDKDGLTLVEVSKSGDVTEHRIRPIDVLRDGKVLAGADPRHSYRWADVRPGDEIHVRISQDRVDEEMYCQEVSIVRRPGGKLPASQKAERDVGFAELTLFNDIDNGEDVSDGDIAKAFPSSPERFNPRGDLLRRASPGGLPAEYQKKLDAIRAKKAKELKVPSPDKK